MRTIIRLLIELDSHIEIINLNRSNKSNAIQGQISIIILKDKLNKMQYLNYEL